MTDGRKVTSTITPSNLLASTYVPNELKAINAAPVSVYLPTKELPSMKVEVERVFYGLIGSNGESYTTSGNGDNSSSAAHYDHSTAVDKMGQLKNDHRSNYNQQHDYCNNIPKAIKTVNEASFAATQARNRLAFVTKEPSTNSTAKIHDNTNTDSCSGTKATNIPLIGKDMVSSGHGETWNIQHYLSVFRELLQVEHAESQRLYEASYSLYSVKITNPVAASTDGGKINNGIAQFKVMGIADGRPSIKPGDRLLIRPHRGIDFFGNPRIANMNYNDKRYPSMVEIVANVLAMNRGGETRRKGKKKDTVLISWVEDSFLDSQLKKQLCTVRFVPSSTTHERSLTALHWLRTIDPAVARDLLFPSKSPGLPPPPAIEESNIDADTTEEREYEQLNTNQSRFVEMVIARTAYPTKERVRPPMVLTGPAGTGKTKTLLAAILQVLHRDQMQQVRQNSQQEQRNSESSMPHRSRILICTPSHTACDVITERLANLLSEKFNDTKEGLNQVRKMLFRLNDATRRTESVPVQILPYTRQGGSGGYFVLPDISELLDFSVIVCTCQDAHLLFLAGLTNSCLRRRRPFMKLDIERRLMKAGLKLQGTIEGCKRPHFTHLFIDEAAQATEPECLIPISIVVDDDSDAFKAEIALCGDPRQLGPRIYSSDAMEGLQRSLLERLLRLPVDTYGGGRDHLMGPPTAGSRLTLDEMIEYSFQKTDHRQNLSVFLNLSYRGHPSFLFIPSKLFYFDKLRSFYKNFSDAKWIKAVREIESLSENAFPENLALKQMDWPIVFRGVKGKCTSVAIESFFGSNCWCNHAEANVVVDIIEKAIKSNGISTASIGVMAAFRAQVVLIRKILRARNLGNVNVGMVEDYQSMERHIIILSLTRTNKSLMHADVRSGEGLFHQHKRMNVALTRAEQILVVVGEPNLMREDRAWMQWLIFCRDNGLWYGEKGEEMEKMT